MATDEASMVVKQLDCGHNQPQYEVTQTRNTTIHAIGEILTKKQVKEMIDLGLVNITIKGG